MDETAFTIVLQEDMPGLEVETASGLWIDVPPIKDSLVINIGDYMARWTNDRYQSTKHRVINTSGHARYSIPFFYLGNPDVPVECIPSCLAPGEIPKYPTTTIGRHYEEMYGVTYGLNSSECDQ